MSLALEISTKFNLDKTGVWSSWGLFCIRAGDLPAARTKFQQCLKVSLILFYIFCIIFSWNLNTYLFMLLNKFSHSN